MKSREELENVKNFIDRAYSRFRNRISVRLNDTFDPNESLGYCYKYTDPTTGNIVYRVVCSKIGIERTDFRVMMHEYGHIYLGHLDGIHEELDTQICKIFKEHRGELIERINKECGIDFGDKLVERVIDDPALNHSLHNIAMDMEVNSKILSKEDIEEMERDVTSVLPKYEEEYLKYLIDKTDDEEKKKALQDTLKKMENETKIKLILPERYEFPDGLTYPEYLIMIIKSLDKFVKMMVSIMKGGNGDTSGITSDDVRDALNQGQGNGSGQGQGDGNSQGSGEGSGMSSLDDLMAQMGIGNRNGKVKGKNDQSVDSPYKGNRGSNGSGEGEQDSQDGDKGKGYNRDHNTESRDQADKKRELGQITSTGSDGCGNDGGPDVTREVDKQADEVEMALTEVFRNFKKKVIKRSSQTDLTFLYNRGIIRTVIAPTVRQKVSKVKDPSVTFLIDISGSMDTRLVDRCLKTIAKSIKKLNRGLRYNIITWSTRLGEHITGINPAKGVPRISCGGGTSIAGGIKYFKDNYSEDSILVIISDFEDYLEEWAKVEETMPGYTMYGFNYGSRNYNQNFKYLKVKNFSNYGY